MKQRKFSNKDVEKPCRCCGYCPYGVLVEDYPLHPEFADEKSLNNLNLETGYNCSIFGHDCPVFYVAESFVDNGGDCYGD